jgi:hypothetical protein
MSIFSDVFADRDELIEKRLQLFGIDNSSPILSGFEIVRGLEWSGTRRGVPIQKGFAHDLSDALRNGCALACCAPTISLAVCSSTAAESPRIPLLCLRVDGLADLASKIAGTCRKNTPNAMI